MIFWNLTGSYPIFGHIGFCYLCRGRVLIIWIMGVPGLVVDQIGESNSIKKFYLVLILFGLLFGVNFRSD